MKRSTNMLVIGILVVGALLAALPGGGAMAAAGDTTLVSRATGASGAQGSQQSNLPSISANGRYVAFWSWGGNLDSVPADLNYGPDVFVRDRQTETTERVSVDSTGTVGGNDYSWNGVISADGRYVAFVSLASNLVSGDTASTQDVFRHDNVSGETIRISLDSNETPASGGYDDVPAVSGDGRFVAFYSTATTLVTDDSNGYGDVFIRDSLDGTTERISVGLSGEPNGKSNSPSISRDGRYVAFASAASNLVAPDGNGVGDIFVRDRTAGTIERVSVSSGGVEANGVSQMPSISGDGRYVVFASAATNLVTGDGNGYQDIFVHDRQTHQTDRVSVDSSGGDANNYSRYPAISGHGRYVAFSSFATDLVAADSNTMEDVFIRDLLASQTRRVSVSAAGQPGNANSLEASIYAGNLVAFNSSADNLLGAGNDTNGTINDIFVHETDDVQDLGAKVLSVVRADPSPTSAASVDYTVTFSAAVTGVATHDFELTKAGISGGSVKGITGSGTTYTVTVNTGTGDGTLRLDVHDDDGIVDAWLDPLGSPGEHNGNFTSGEVYTLKKTMSFKSSGVQDGWILESGEATNAGGTSNSTATTLRLGDDAAKRQYRSVLSFGTAGLPDNAVITKATLTLKRQGVTGGGNPFSMFQGMFIDIKKGYFGTGAGLVLGDFQATAGKAGVGPFSPTLVSGVYTINMPSTTFPYINKLSTNSGLTQIRLRFKLDDNNNTVANYISLYSGNHTTASCRPTLTIAYHAP